ncbi:hypothetical protein AAF712_015041 [Marasmius tenuissimus]|uniref:Protein kinase domain-containing protein n=1 Tax=Marasmius tenuissimus TaxID=585030 RepID=A0ABR2Z9D6_9AGAR
MAVAAPTQANYFNGGNNNANFGSGTQNIHKGRDFNLNNANGVMNVNNYGQDEEEEDENEDGPLPPKKFQRELKLFKRLYPKLNDDALGKIDGQEYLDRWQRLIISDLPGKELSTADKTNILDAMERLSNVCNLSPKCLCIRDVGIEVPADPIANHDAPEVEVFKGKVGTLDVIVKALNQQPGLNDQQLKMPLKTAITWRKLQHDNVLLFLGLYYFDESRSRACLVYPWMEQRSFESDASGESEAEGIIDGLKYIHSHNIVHGNLSKRSLLIDPPSAARIADLGLAQLLGKAAGKSLDSDKYQCARTLYMVLGGKLPLKYPLHQPLEVPDSMWKVLEEWLREDSSSRTQKAAAQSQ